MLTFARYYVQELMAAKDRQDVETAAQRETLQVRSLSSSVVDLGHFGTDPVRNHGSVQLAYGMCSFRHTVKTIYIYFFAYYLTVLTYIYIILQR
jgi:hypothetical protein